MAKLYFYFGSMNSSKTAQALMVAHNYHERKQDVWLLKPVIDTREGNDSIIKSRCGISSKNVFLFDEKTNLLDEFFNHNVKTKTSCVIVDECQFLTKEQVIALSDVVDGTYNVPTPVMCYGLRTNFKGELFEGSKWLMAYADSIEEIKTICWCGRKATFNARIKDATIVKEGDEIMIGGNESYTSLCRKHWKEGKISL